MPQLKLAFVPSFSQLDISVLLFATWLACGLNCARVRAICEAAGINSKMTDEVVRAYRDARGSMGV